MQIKPSVTESFRLLPTLVKTVVRLHRRRDKLGLLNYRNLSNNYTWWENRVTRSSKSLLSCFSATGGGAGARECVLVVKLRHVNLCLCEQTHPLEPTLALLVQIGNYRAVAWVPADFHM